MTNAFGRSVTMAFWAEAIYAYFRTYPAWLAFKRAHWGTSVYRQAMADAIGLYCMGGEL